MCTHIYTISIGDDAVLYVFSANLIMVFSTVYCFVSAPLIMAKCKAIIALKVHIITSSDRVQLGAICSFLCFVCCWLEAAAGVTYLVAIIYL